VSMVAMGSGGHCGSLVRRYMSAGIRRVLRPIERTSRCLANAAGSASFGTLA